MSDYGDYDLRDREMENEALEAERRANEVSDPRELAVPPMPDPCLVQLRIDGWGATKKRVERAWVEARKCPLGCGEKCQRLAMPDPRELAATVREALTMDAGTFVERQHTKGIAALDALVAECEAAQAAAVVVHGDWPITPIERKLEEALRERDRLSAAMNEVGEIMEQRDRFQTRAEAAERDRDALIADSAMDQENARAAEARARRYAEALRAIDAYRVRPVDHPTLAYAEVCEIARAALAKEQT